MLVYWPYWPSWLKALAVKLSRPSGRSGSYTGLIGFNPRRLQGPKGGWATTQMTSVSMRNLLLLSEFRVDRPIRLRDMASVRHLEFKRNRFILVKFACSEWKFVSVYQIWSKSDNSRLRYGDKAIFKMAAVRHLEMAKIAVLVTWPISACDPSSRFQISRWSANMAPRCSQKTIFNMASVRHLGLLWRHHIASENCILRSQLCVKFSRRSFA